MPILLTPEQRARKAAYKKLWKEQNPERVKAHRKAWYQKNKDTPERRARKAAYDTIYQAKNRARLTAAAKARRHANPESTRAARLRWYYANRERAKAAHQEWLKNNREQHLTYSRQYEESHREERRSKRRAAYINNLENERAKFKRYYHTDKYRQARTAWKQANKAAIQTWSQNRRARKHSAGSHTTAEWEAVLKAHGNRCSYCGIKGTKNAPLTRDHYIPLACGGSNNISNLVPACASCNFRKHTSDPIRFARSLGLLL